MKMLKRIIDWVILQFSYESLPLRYTYSNEEFYTIDGETFENVQGSIEVVRENR